MRIITPAQRVRVTQYSLNFTWKDTPGAGFSFPCDKDGNVDTSAMYPAGLENLAKCLDGTYAVTAQGIRDESYSYWDPTVGLCDNCDREVSLSDAMTNTCDCGYEYNGGGQLLAPRAQWEEDY